MPAVIIALILVLSAGGTVAASQNDLPGDALHGVKLAVERVQAGLTVSAEAKIKNAARRAERRLDEVEKLQEREKTLSAEAKSNVKANFARFEEHVAEVRARLSALKEDNPEVAARAAAGLEVALERHSEILTRLSARLDDAAEARLRAEKAVEETREEVRKSAPPATDVKASAEGRITAAGNKIAEVERRLVALKAQGMTSSESEAQLTLARQQLSNAKASVAAGNYNQAFLQAGTSIKLSIQAQILLEAKVEGGSATGTSRGEQPTSRPTTSPSRGGVNANVNVNVEVR